MKILVLANGDGRRWDVDGQPYLGHPKHFVEIDGETLIGRAVRLMVERGHDVTVVGPDERYRCTGADLETLSAINTCGSDMGKFLDTAHLWSPEGRTVILWGDVYYTEATADLVSAHPSDDYVVFRRPGASATTGHRWDESFAVSFGPHEHARVLDCAKRLAALVRRGSLKSTHIRTHMAAMAGVGTSRLDDVRLAATLSNQVAVDDWTDDFDTPAEWRGWTGRHFAGRYRLGVCIPWCGGEFHRAASFDWVRTWYETLGVPVFVGDDETGGSYPNRSAMRNAAARRALDAGCEALLFADADTFVPSDQMWAAAHLAIDRGQLVPAYTKYVRIREGATRRLRVRGARPNREFARYAGAGAYHSASHVSGAVVIPASLWGEIGGYDERFVRWGFEDRAIWLAALVLGDGTPRVDGSAWHWWHPTAEDKDRSSAEYRAGAELGRRYKIAAAWAPKAGAMHPVELPEGAEPDPVTMRAILSEPGGPLGLVAGGDVINGDSLLARLRAGEMVVPCG